MTERAFHRIVPPARRAAIGACWVCANGPGASQARSPFGARKVEERPLRFASRPDRAHETVCDQILSGASADSDSMRGRQFPAHTIEHPYVVALGELSLLEAHALTPAIPPTITRPTPGTYAPRCSARSAGPGATFTGVQPAAVRCHSLADRLSGSKPPNTSSRWLLSLYAPAPKDRRPIGHPRPHGSVPLPTNR